MPVNPAELELFSLLAKRQAEQPNKPIPELTLEEFRGSISSLLEFTGPAADVQYQDTTVPARDGYQIPIRIYNPGSTKTPVLILFPGCGYVIDLFSINAIPCSRIAKYTGIKVILVNYRLTPEYPLPISIYDGYDAVRHITLYAEKFAIDNNRIFIGGFSSGAHCAAVISNLARQDKDLKIYHQILLNGVYDYALFNKEHTEDEKQDQIFTAESLAYIVKIWNCNIEQQTNPLYWPYYEKDLSNLPTTTIIASEYDRIRSHSEAYYQKLKQAGNSVEKIILVGQTHNTIILFGAMAYDIDPAQTIAEVVKKHLN